MKTGNYKIIKADDVHEVNPAYLAELYANMGSDEQASFWHLVAFHFVEFGGAKGCSQNAMIASEMTGAAKAHVKNLADHIDLIEAEQCATCGDHHDDAVPFGCQTGDRQ